MVWCIFQINYSHIPEISEILKQTVAPSVLYLVVPKRKHTGMEYLIPIKLAQMAKGIPLNPSLFVLQLTLFNENGKRRHSGYPSSKQAMHLTEL